MLRNVFTIGLFALLGLFALKLVFNILPVVLGILAYFVVLALKIALFGLAVYFVIRIFSPETARRLRSRWSGTAP
jgi:hypothetical protein